MESEMDIRGIKLAYDDLGKGDVILLIHGQPFNRSMWNYQLDILSRDHRLIIPDLRGYGDSGITERMVLLDELALDLIHLLNVLNINKVHVIGLSMGGQVALELLALRPGLFRSIVLADTEARAEDEVGYQNRLTLSKKILDDGMEKFTTERINQFLCRSTFAHKPAIVEHVRKMMVTTNAKGASAVQRGRAERLDYTPLLEKIDFPALIIVGDQDEFTPVASAAYMHKRIKNSKLAIIADCGHISNMENTDDFNGHLTAFYQLLSSG
jgi:3-oxoadipate enol-lactonase